MKVPLAGLGEGTHEFSFNSEAEAIGLGQGFSPVGVWVVLEKTEDKYVLASRITAEAASSCDRCLAPFTAALTPSFTTHYVFRDDHTEQFGHDEVVVLPLGTPAIDISEDVRQTVLMAVPLKLLCKESCRGLCPQCGKNLNEGPCECRPETIDSRWDALRDLKIQ